MMFLGLFLLISELKNALSTNAPIEEKLNDIKLLKTPQLGNSISFQRRSLLFVSTVDGRLTCINAKSGDFLWEFDLQQPLLSSSISSIRLGADLAKPNFIPSLDGTLYKWNGRYLESLTLSTEYLVGTKKKLPDGKYVVGGSTVAVYGVDIQTGEIIYDSSGSGCRSSNTGRKIDQKDVLSLRKSEHVVRAVDRLTGHESWNYSVGRYEMELGETNNDIQLNNGDIGSSDLHFLVREGRISNTAMSWSLSLKSPITDVWQLDNGNLKTIDIFRYGLFEGLNGFPAGKGLNGESVMFMGVHEGQLYIQKPTGSSHGRRKLRDKSGPLQLDVSEWRPFISTSPSRTPALNNKEKNGLSVLDYPFDNGYVLVSNNSPTAVGVIDREEVLDEENMDMGECINGMQWDGHQCIPQDTESPYLGYVPLSAKDWWKEILFLSILIAVAINVSLKLVKHKFLKQRNVNIIEAEETSQVNQEQAEKMSTILSKPKVERTSSHSLSGVNNDSRYTEEFEHLEVLGKGGFGVVFKAKKKIDDCDYAIKRIYLPRCDEAKSKMMREVKALAALDHRGIVRYFNAWWEEPLPDWQKNDKMFLKSDSLYSTSYALSNDWALEIQDKSQNNSGNLLTAPVTTEKRTSDDPLGKRFNFDTGIDDLISDHMEFDLLKHNDVFYGDDESVPRESMEVDGLNVDDSFIVFESNNTSTDRDLLYKEISQESGSSIDTHSHKITKRKEINSTPETISDDSKSNNNSNRTTRRRYVGKCCGESSLCLTQPPLFLYIQMQLCKSDTLKDWLKTQVSGISLVESMAIFMQIVDAVEYFHSLGLMHRDLKPANILFSLDGSVKVGDFGLVTAITGPSTGKSQGKTYIDENHTGQVGTQLYMSPEQASGKAYSHKVDIYSLGLILFELVSAFSTEMERMQVIYKLKQGLMPSELSNTPQGRLVQILTAENPNLRPEAKDIKQHELIGEINNNMSSHVSNESADT